MSARLTPLEQFMALRLRGGSEWVGISSNAMVDEAVTGREVDLWDYPSDFSDLARCCVTWARAPWDLKRDMLPRLQAYIEHIAAKESERVE